MKLFNLAATVSVIALSVSAASAGTVFIPEGSADSVLVVDSDTGQTIRRIDGLEAVHGLAGRPGVKYLVAGSYTEIDREDAAAAAAPEGVSADEHEAHHAKPAANAMPQDMGLSLLSVLDAESGDILRRIEVPGAVHHTAISPDGKLALATHPAGDGISVIDLETMSYRGFIPTGSLPNYAEFSPDSSTAYVTNGGNGTVSVVDLREGYVTRNIRVGEGPEHVVLNAGGTLAYVADSDGGTAYRLDLAQGKVTGTYALGGELHGISLSDREDTLFVTGKENDQLIAIDLATGSQSTAPLAPAPYHMTAVPGSGALFVSSREEPRVWIVDQATLQTTGEIEIRGEGHQMVALP